MFEPLDNQEYRDIYEPQGRGICGISCLAVICKCSCKEILGKWGDYRGFTPNRELRSFLEKEGYIIKVFRGNKRKDFPYFEDKIYLCRVQWLGDEGGEFHGYSNWHDATCNTHLIVVDGTKVYCNAQGWFNLELLPQYLGDEGYITSFFEVQKIQ